ncbi:MAG: hypothetical protein Q7S99_07380 [Parvibaculum sp.]|nr:hypothetical protein [Parvibaculum sp.]
MTSDRKAKLLIRTGLLLACLTLTPSASANIFGTDDRRLITDADDLSAVGLIVCEGTTRRPTATLIAPNNRGPHRLIISVAHSFLGLGNAPLTPCAFWPGGHESDAVGITAVFLGTNRPTGEWNEDWSVALIAATPRADYQPLRPLVMTVAEANAARAHGAPFLLAGHNGETGPMMWSGRCGPVAKINADINRFDDRAFNHDCDMMPGWSGGPLMLQREGQRYVIAVNATELNALVTRNGEPYNGSYNANTAVRIDGRFLDAITFMARAPLPPHAPYGVTACRLWAAPPEAMKPC